MHTRMHLHQRSMARSPCSLVSHIGVRSVVQLPVRPRTTAVCVAAVEEASGPEQLAGPTVQPQSGVVSQPAEVAAVAQSAADVELENLEIAELESAADEALGWLLAHNADQQEADLDEMVDYDEFGDDEYADLHSEVEVMLQQGAPDLRVGDRIVGTVYQVDEEGAYVEIGQKASGFVPLAECSFAKLKSPLEVLRVGMRREFIVVDREDEFGQIVLSLAAIEATVFWQRIHQFHAEQVTVTVTVESANKGGLLVKYGPYEGFVPVSQFGMGITVDNMEELVGRQLQVKFLEVDEERERLVFSHRKASGSVDSTAAALKVGDVVDGVVSSVKPYGAFVDIGGATGLLHISQISHERVTNVEKVLNEGDRLKVMVLGHDRERGRVTLSTKKLEANDGDMLRNPQLVWDNAESAAAVFKTRIAEATAQAASGPTTDPSLLI